MSFDLVALQNLIDRVHKEVLEQNQETHSQSWNVHNARMNVIPINFTNDDYAFVPKNNVWIRRARC